MSRAGRWCQQSTRANSGRSLDGRWSTARMPGARTCAAVTDVVRLRTTRRRWRRPGGQSVVALIQPFGSTPDGPDVMPDASKPRE